MMFGWSRKNPEGRHYHPSAYRPPAYNAAIGDTGGVGYYPRAEFVHIDVRGHFARWTG